MHLESLVIQRVVEIFLLPAATLWGLSICFTTFSPSPTPQNHKVSDKVCVLKGNWLQWEKQSREGLLSAMSHFDSLPLIGNTQLESSPEQVFPDTPFPHVDFLRVSKLF